MTKQTEVGSVSVTVSVVGADRDICSTVHTELCYSTQELRDKEAQIIKAVGAALIGLMEAGIAADDAAGK